MPAMLSQTRYGRKGSQSLFCKFGGREISELTCRLPCIQKQTQICRGEASRGGRWFFLNVVRYRPVVFFGAEFGKISPRMSGGIPKESHFSERDKGSRRRWPVQPFGRIGPGAPLDPNRRQCFA